jgi:hypothetical protein
VEITGGGKTRVMLSGGLPGVIAGGLIAAHRRPRCRLAVRAREITRIRTAPLGTATWKKTNWTNTLKIRGQKSFLLESVKKQERRRRQ